MVNSSPRRALAAAALILGSLLAPVAATPIRYDVTNLDTNNAAAAGGALSQVDKLAMNGMNEHDILKPYSHPVSSPNSNNDGKKKKHKNEIRATAEQSKPLGSSLMHKLAVFCHAADNTNLNTDAHTNTNNEMPMDVEMEMEMPVDMEKRQIIFPTRSTDLTGLPTQTSSISRPVVPLPAPISTRLTSLTSLSSVSIPVVSLPSPSASTDLDVPSLSTSISLPVPTPPTLPTPPTIPTVPKPTTLPAPVPTVPLPGILTLTSDFLTRLLVLLGLSTSVPSPTGPAAIKLSLKERLQTLENQLLQRRTFPLPGHANKPPLPLLGVPPGDGFMSILPLPFPGGGGAGSPPAATLDPVSPPVETSPVDPLPPLQPDVPEPSPAPEPAPEPAPQPSPEPSPSPIILPPPVAPIPTPTTTPVATPSPTPSRTPTPSPTPTTSEIIPDPSETEILDWPPVDWPFDGPGWEGSVTAPAVNDDTDSIFGGPAPDLPAIVDGDR